MSLTVAQIIQGLIAAALVGFSKTGIAGLGILIVPLMMNVFPGKENTGALLPMLAFADIFAVAYYRRHAQWPVVLKLLPWVLPGLFLGCLALNRISNAQVNLVFGFLIMAMVALKLWQDRSAFWQDGNIQQRWWLAAIFGILAGFTTMLGNLAGPIMSIYLLTMGLPKKEFIGTGAWYYLIVNTVKIPFSIYLGLISAESLRFNVMAAPLILVGVFAGIWVFPRISQKWFNAIILLLAFAAALRLLYLYFFA
jgi:uncharacterized protein